MSKMYPFFLSLALVGFISCGSDDDDNGTRRDSPIPQEEVREARDFSTRLDNNLLVQGSRCEGGETTEYENESYTCEEGQWLMMLDNQNTCTDDGICTQIAVPSIIADLRQVSGPDAEFNYAAIEAISPVNEKQQEVIDSVYVRYDDNGDTEAVKR